MAQQVGNMGTITKKNERNKTNKRDERRKINKIIYIDIMIFH